MVEQYADVQKELLDEVHVCDALARAAFSLFVHNNSKIELRDLKFHQIFCCEVVIVQ